MKPPLPYARSFRELIVYKKARELQRRVFEASRTFPREETYSLTDQLRRASRSIGAQIADADGEQMETQHWILCAVDCGYWERGPALELFELCAEIGRMLNSMKERSSEFCPTDSGTLHETPSDFFTTESPESDEHRDPRPSTCRPNTDH